MLPICKLPLPVWCASLPPGTMGISLLDPSCSGSGIINRLDHLTEQGMSADPPHSFFFPPIGHDDKDKEDEDDFSKLERLEKLASFQLMMIKHAMKCECRGPPSLGPLSFPSRELRSRVIPMPLPRVTLLLPVRSSVSATPSGGVTFPPDVSTYNSASDPAPPWPGSSHPSFGSIL